MINDFIKKILPAFVLFQLILPLAMGLAQEPHVRQRETNPNYRGGDWTSYSVARFVTSIAVGRQYIYFGTRYSGITRFHRYRESWDYPWTISNGLTDNSIWVVAYDENTDFIWCASHHAISYFHPSARTWHNSFKEEIGLPQHDEIESIGVGPDKIYFISRAGRTFESNHFGGVVLVATGGPIGRNNKIRWFGRRAQSPRELPQFFMSNGYLFNPGGVVEDAHFRQAEIVSAVEDDWGNLWLATWGLGAGKADTRSLRLEMLGFGLANSSVTAMAYADDVLWLGGSSVSELDRGATAWDTNRDTWEYFEQKYISALRSDQINQISVDDETVWLSTNYGLSKYSRNKNEWTTFDSFDGLADNIVNDVVVDDSSIWVATANGINRINRFSLVHRDSVDIETISPGNLALVEVRDLELTHNLLWAATSDGIYIYDTHKREGGYNAEIAGPFSNSITSISHYKSEIWFGSASGIDVFDMNKREWLGVPEGRALPNIYINKVIATKEAVWAATDHGVKKFDRTSRNWRTFTTEDGLIDNRVHTILLDHDYIWFGTASGVTHFFWNDPGRID